MLDRVLKKIGKYDHNLCSKKCRKNWTKCRPLRNFELEYYSHPSIIRNLLNTIVQITLLKWKIVNKRIWLIVSNAFLSSPRVISKSIECFSNVSSNKDLKLYKNEKHSLRHSLMKKRLHSM